MIHIFRGEGTLTPPGLTMSAAFEGWFLDWALEHPYALLLDGDVKRAKNNIPSTVIYKSEYTFANNGKDILKYSGGNWMKPIGKQDDGSPDYDMMLKFLSQRYERFAFFSHEKDSVFRGAVNSYKNWDCFFIEEWKDTALYMKQLIWDSKDYGKSL